MLQKLPALSLCLFLSLVVCAADAVAAEPPALSDSVARVFSGGRVGAGLVLPEGKEVLTLLTTVRLGSPIEVRLGNGHSSVATIVASSRDLGLAIITLEQHSPSGGTLSFAAQLPELGDEVRIIGHGGSSKNDDSSDAVTGLATFSSLWARVAAVHGDSAGVGAPSFLLDRSTGKEDLGAPIFNASGEVTGMVAERLKDSGGRALALAAPSLSAFVTAERDAQPYQRPHHLQAWGGVGMAVHNRPTLLGGLVMVGVRGVLFDRLRIEPWVEADFGTRAPIIGPDGSEQARPRETWWSLETGVHIGYRVPIFSEGGRNYFVPHVGIRAGWNRFQHEVEEITALCGKTGLNCEHTLERSVDQLRSFRVGIELGVDLRHGPMRIGYRFFLDPAHLQAHSMHRIVLTFDAVNFPPRVGDSN